MEEKDYMKDCFNKIADNYSDVGARTIVIFILAMTNKYIYSFLWEMINVMSFFGGVTHNQEEIIRFFTQTIIVMGERTRDYNSLFNNYLQEGRVALIRDCLAFVDKERNKAR
jgi:hypothetical protein